MATGGSAVLRIGDAAEFHRSGNPQPDPEWNTQVVTEIRVLEEYEDTEGTPVSEISWSAIHDYQCLVVVIGTENWARNEDVRPARRKAAARFH